MIAIIDYGMGNLRSVQKGFEKVGHQAVVTSDPAEVAAAAKVVLPGVGAFEECIAELRRRNLVESVREAIDAGKPFLGICLGLQLLFDVSYENGRHEGLGIFSGEVVRFELPKEYAVPHMGWNQLTIRRPAPILDGIAASDVRLFCPLVLCCAERCRRDRHRDGLRQAVLLDDLARQRLCHPVPPREEPVRGATHSEKLRRAVGWDKVA